MAKLAIVEEREEDKYDHSTQLKCWKCNPSEGQIVSGVPEVKVRWPELSGWISDLTDVRQKSW